MKLLTDAELQLMNHLWKLGEATVHDVLAETPKAQRPAYTTVSTILRILEQKGAVGSRKEGRGHVYFAKVPKSRYEATSVQHLMKNVFHGEASSLVRCLLDSAELNSKEIEALQRLLTEKLSP